MASGVERAIFGGSVECVDRCADLRGYRGRGGGRRRGLSTGSGHCRRSGGRRG